MEEEGSSPAFLRKKQERFEAEKEFIRKFKELPALWDTRHRHYTNNYKRLGYLEQLRLVYKKIKPNATTKDVRKKINILRTNFKRELNKVVESKRRNFGEPTYWPRVWYFPLLNFLVKNKQIKMPVQTINLVDEEEDAPDMNQLYLGYNGLDDLESVELSDDEAIVEEPATPEDENRENGNSRNRLRVEYQPDVTNTSDAWTTPEKTSNPLAMIWSEKLEKLDSIQKLYAEKAINDIMFEAELGNLNRFSVVINRTNRQEK